MAQKTQWGLHRVVPHNARAVWGARGIFRPQDNNETTWDLVYSDHWGENDTTEKALLRLLNECRILEAAYRVFQEKAKNELIDRTSSDVHTLYDCLGLKVQCSTNSSHGYVYISAWLEAFPMPLEPRSFDNGADVLTWSNDELPRTGDRVLIAMNNIGLATVVDYFVETYPATHDSEGGNYLYLITQPENPSEQWKTQALNKLESKKPMGMVCCVMGREWEHPS